MAFRLAALSDGEPVPVRIETSDQTDGWSLEGSVAEADDVLRVDLDARREMLAISFTLFDIGGIVVVGLITVALIGGSIVRGVVDFGQVIWLGAMLVAWWWWWWPPRCWRRSWCSPSTSGPRALRRCRRGCCGRRRPRQPRRPPSRRRPFHCSATSCRPTPLCGAPGRGRPLGVEPARRGAAGPAPLLALPGPTVTLVAFVGFVLASQNGLGAVTAT